MKDRPDCFIFDLDGVITDTAEYHYLAWLELANSLNMKFDRSVNERLKGVTRIRSLEIILESNDMQNEFSLAEKLDLVEIKNRSYVERIKGISEKDILGGISELIQKAKENHIKIALASASRNAYEVLELLKMTDLFDYIADAGKINNPKPAPDIFQECAVKLGVACDRCIGFEDSDAGITAIKTAGMFAVGIQVVRENDQSFYPDFHVKKTSLLDYDQIIHAYQCR